MKKQFAISIVSISTVMMCVSSASAINKLEGYYELEASAQRINQRWQFGPPSWNGMPRHYLELKYLSYPYTSLESFFRLRAETNRDDFLTPYPEYKYPFYLAAEGHLKFRNDKHWETYLFYRQNRFWIHDEPLLRLVEQDKVKNDNWGPQSSGIRADFWDLGFNRLQGFGGTFIYFDDGSTFNWTEDPNLAVPNGTDNFILRLRKNSLKDRLIIGGMFLRKDWTNTSVGEEWIAKSFNEVLSVDVSLYPRELFGSGLVWGPLNLESSSWIVEYAESRDPFQQETSDVRGFSNNHAFAAEVRNIRLYRWFFHAWYYNFGENFRNYMSWRFDEGREFNREGYHLEGIFLMPVKAVTATVAYDFYEKHIVDEEGGDLRPTSLLYAELYVEFIKGFKGKIAYSHWDGFDAAGEVFDFYRYPNFYAELSVENSLARVRLQGRIRDQGTFRQVYAYGFDVEFNATGKLKGYYRLLNVDEKTEARSTMFAQIRYDIGYGAEFFIEYGDPGRSEHLVNTDYYVNEGSFDRLDNRLKLFLRLYF